MSVNSIFFKTPDHPVTVDEKLVSKYARNQTIEMLVEELKEKGPMIACGKMGPNAYTTKPFKLKMEKEGQAVFGWKKGAEHVKQSVQDSFILLGAEKRGEKSYVYFTPSMDITKNSDSYTRQHLPLDRKIYITSHETFRNYLFDIYPPKVEEKGPAGLSDEECKYAEQLVEIQPLDSILDRDVVEARCKKLGQEIFDAFGKEGAIKICESMKTLAEDGKLRKQYIERAWDGIGDDNWRWRA